MHVCEYACVYACMGGHACASACNVCFKQSVMSEPMCMWILLVLCLN